ncbi:MAG: DsrE family protein [Nitrospirae bacterium]|nr:DsrE family protein [Nitrospirota bacterium]
MCLFGCLALIAVVTLCAPAYAADQDLSPYGTAKVNLHKYNKKINRVYDVNYIDPQHLNVLANFITNVNKEVEGESVVVLHGPEIRVFAKENYEKYQGIVDKMAGLAKSGVDFRMCNNAMHAAGFEAKDIVGFVTIIPAGFAELIDLESKGYQPIIAIVTPVKDSRYLDHPELKPVK